MADIKAKYGTSNQSITITLNSLANDAKRESTAIDNSSNLFFDALVQVKVATNASSDSTGDKSVYIYAYGTADAGTTYSGNASGTDSSFGTDPQQLANCKLIGVIYAPTANKTYESDLMSIANAFGGKLPERWGVVAHNKTGYALNSGGNSVFYQGILAQSV
jgi:hypothetical protein